MLIKRILSVCLLSCLFLTSYAQKNISQLTLKLNELEYFEARGINVMGFTNSYSGPFSDSKMSGVEIIHHEVRTATNGDVRLGPTPGQWDPIPQFVERKVNKDKNMIEAFLKYPEYEFEYSIRVEGSGEGLLNSCNTNNTLPKVLEGKAGLNLEFLPSAYFEKAYLMDDRQGIFPLYPGGPMEITGSGIVEPKPFAEGKTLVLAPEDPAKCVTIKSAESKLLLYDGRNKAQNGWFVVRSLIPSGKSGKVVEWSLTANKIPAWVPQPVIASSHAGDHPDQKKPAIIELDKNDISRSAVSLFKVTAD